MARARAVVLVAGALLAFVAADTKHCYYPDGTLADAATSPCNTTTEASACCDPRDSCTTSGLCLGASGWIYRASCTDQTWTSRACPTQCHIDPILNAPYSSFAPIYPCVAGLYPTNFCSGSYSNRNCCGSNFTIYTGLAFKPGTDAVEAQISSLSAVVSSATAASSQATVTTTATTTATVTATSSSSSNSLGIDLGTAIGAGVGVPLGVIALGLLGFLIWRERRLHRGLLTAGQGGQGWKDPSTPVTPAVWTQERLPELRHELQTQ